MAPATSPSRSVPAASPGSGSLKSACALRTWQVVSALPSKGKEGGWALGINDLEQLFPELK